MSRPAAPNASVEWTGTGYPGVDIGMASSIISDTKPWMNELRQVVKRGVPVIVLQQFSFDDAGGHYRVVYGFNDTHIYMKDPWGRDDTPRDMKLSNENFVTLWRYTEFASIGPRYTGISAAQWSIFPQSQGVLLSGRTMKMRLGYQAAPPFFQLLSPAFFHTLSPILELQFDPSIFNNTKSVFTAAFEPVHLGSNSFYFEANCAAPSITDCFNTVILARISGLIQANVLTAPKTENSLYPAYDYIDLIGSPWTKVTILSP